MASMMRRIYLPMAMPLATNKHCSNDCLFMDEQLVVAGVDLIPSTVKFYCRLFSKDLTWDQKRKTHGNLRLSQCKKAEKGREIKPIADWHVNCNYIGEVIMGWKLFLDDQCDEPGMPIRQCPEGFTAAKSVVEAQILITMKGLPEFIDFDHDLGDGHDAPELIKWMIAEFVPLKAAIPEYNVHSQNPAGRLAITSLMETWKKLLAD